MKAALVLSLLLVAAYAAPAQKDKRLFESISHLFHEAGNAIAHTFNQAKDAFNTATHGLGINFDDVVNQLIPLIDSGMTESACVSACVGASSTILGPAAPLAGTVCAPVCKAALAKLEETAGK